MIFEVKRPKGNMPPYMSFHPVGQRMGYLPPFWTKHRFPSRLLIKICRRMHVHGLEPVRLCELCREMRNGRLEHIGWYRIFQQLSWYSLKGYVIPYATYLPIASHCWLVYT